MYNKTDQTTQYSSRDSWSNYTHYTVKVPSMRSGLYSDSNVDTFLIHYRPTYSCIIMTDFT